MDWPETIFKTLATLGTPESARFYSSITRLELRDAEDRVLNLRLQLHRLFLFALFYQVRFFYDF